MGETTGIAWTDSTINVWHGCDKVSAGCKHCYAEVSAPVRVKRAKGLEVWGASAARVETKSWEANLRRWNREAAASSKPWRVFGQSLADTFEDYQGGRVISVRGGPDMTTLDMLRWDFFEAIEAAPALTFQLLTKRPENITRMVPPSWLKSWPAHVWIGCTVEDQENADRRIPELLGAPASAVKFLSVEPQIGPVDLSHWLDCMMCRRCGTAQVPIMDAPTCRCPSTDDGEPTSDFRPGMLDWVIQGGESGTRARPFDLAWARSLRDQCRAAGVAYFLKQLGARPTGWWAGPDGFNNQPGANVFPGDPEESREKWGNWKLKDSHGGDENEWPADLRGCRAFPVTQ